MIHTRTFHVGRNHRPVQTVESPTIIKYIGVGWERFTCQQPGKAIDNHKTVSPLNCSRQKLYKDRQTFLTVSALVSYVYCTLSIHPLKLKNKTRIRRRRGGFLSTASGWVGASQTRRSPPTQNWCAGIRLFSSALKKKSAPMSEGI